MLQLQEFRWLWLTPYLPTLRLFDGVSVFFISPKSPSEEIEISVFWAPMNFFPFLGHHLIFFGNPVEWILKRRDETQAKWVTQWCCLLFSSVFFFVFRSPVRNDGPPPMQHLTPISPIIARSRESRVISSIFSPIHFAMVPLHAWCHIRRRYSTPSFPKHFPLYHTLYIARTRRLWSCGQRRRACGAQQTTYSCLVVFSCVKILWCVGCSQSNWFVIHNSADSILVSSAFVRVHPYAP